MGFHGDRADGANGGYRIEPAEYIDPDAPTDARLFDDKLADPGLLRDVDQGIRQLAGRSADRSAELLGEVTEFEEKRQKRLDEEKEGEAAGRAEASAGEGRRSSFFRRIAGRAALLFP
jgi:hypothetical protein